MCPINMRRAFSILAIPAASGILAGCGGDAEKPSQDPRRRTSTSATAGQTKVVIQMTGSVLVVPPAAAGGATSILLPSTRGMERSHIAWFGFGLAPEHPLRTRLCVTHPEAKKEGICYVNLDQWSVDSIGAGGSPSTTTAAAFRSGLMNLTRESGNTHKVNLGELDDQIRSQFVFMAGQPGDSCSLGKWTFPNQNQGLDSVNLVNVLHWHIEQPQNTLVLRFRLKSNPHTVVSATVHAESGEIALLIAHVPIGERRDLPPYKATQVSQPSGTVSAEHFHSFYDLLRLPPSPNRRIPKLKRPITNQACSVTITTSTLTKFQNKSYAGLKTHACMPALAESEP